MHIDLGVGVLQDLPPQALTAYAAWCESLGYEHFWYANEKFYRDMYVGLTLSAVHTRRMRLGMVHEVLAGEGDGVPHERRDVPRTLVAADLEPYVVEAHDLEKAVAGAPLAWDDE